MQRVICSGYYGKGNGGDEALLASLLQMLPPTVEPIILSGNPSQTQNHYQVEACDRMNGMEVLSALRRADALIWGGGESDPRCDQCHQSFLLWRFDGISATDGTHNYCLGPGYWPLEPFYFSMAGKKNLFGL